MPRYYRESTFYRQINFIKIARRIIFSVFTFMIIVVAFIMYDSFRSSKQANQPSAPTSLTKSSFAASIEIYRTQYFQFQAGKNWRAAANESTATKFVYRKFNKNLVEAQLTIYVNEIADKNIDSNRVLPVTLSSASDRLNATIVSDLCSKVIRNVGYKTISIQKVSFRCNTDTTDFSVLVGKEEGSTLLSMNRPDGSKVTYVIHYLDLRAIASPQDIQEIVGTFQTR